MKNHENMEYEAIMTRNTESSGDGELVVDLATQKVLQHQRGFTHSTVANELTQQ